MNLYKQLKNSFLSYQSEEYSRHKKDLRYKIKDIMKNIIECSEWGYIKRDTCNYDDRIVARYIRRYKGIPFTKIQYKGKLRKYGLNIKYYWDE